MSKKSNSRKISAGTKLTPEIRELFHKVCEAEGLSESELLRQLVLQKLVSLGLINSRIEKIRESA